MFVTTFLVHVLLLGAMSQARKCCTNLLKIRAYDIIFPAVCGTRRYDRGNRKTNRTDDGAKTQTEGNGEVTCFEHFS
jgi:hypothetical protein